MGFIYGDSGMLDTLDSAYNCYRHNPLISSSMNSSIFAFSKLSNQPWTERKKVFDRILIRKLGIRKLSNFRGLFSFNSSQI